MKKNKAMPFAMSALLVGSALTPAIVFAQDDVKENEKEMTPSFIKTEGTIDSVEKRENSTFYTITYEDKPAAFFVTKNTLVFDNSGNKVDLAKGDKVTIYTDADNPMLAIYPPQYNPEVVIVEKDDKGSVAVGTFDEELFSEELSLKLNVGEKTELSSVSGKEVKMDDLKGKDLLVFYTITTRSIPAQTPPEKIVVLDGAMDEVEPTPEPEKPEVTPEPETPETDAAVDAIIAANHKMVNGVKMVPLRAIAEELGYKVKSTGNGAIVSKEGEARSFTITRGEKKYGYNKALRQFEEAPALLEKWTTYVPVSFVDDLME
ncbi:copper amine oxidase N-terminal domain-containing protein [Sporosarcina sp. Sa2YVA2]|uniref:Copper amine oxidase N-terminal domain-containing protein n=1 Tax=Sporosarcina quadrami TaxID=2762234 RepID=A0ABR8U928_9BACL|nr:stalk domain-containing protein [Sporosarcina quadrami]MBD7984542.1 copper amine oxidase N-terminal domain-containing protein [Sporosarcina quadrami]